MRAARKAFDIRSRLVVGRLELSGLLLRLNERGFELPDFIPERSRIDFKQFCASRYQHVWLDRDGDYLAADVGGTSTTRPITTTRPGGVRLFKSAEKTARMKTPVATAIVPETQPQRTSLSFEKTSQSTMR